VAQILFTAYSRRLFDNIRDKKVKDKISLGLQKLSKNPRAGKKLKGKLNDTYSIRIWPYRILYEFNSKRDIIITDIGHRKEIYR